MYELHGLLKHAKTDQELYDAVVNSPFKAKIKGFPLGLGIIVLLLVNKKEGTIDRIALADTEQAQGAVEYSVKPFHEIKIPLRDRKNIISKAINTDTPQQTTDWQYLFTPALSSEEARFNQAGAGIATSIVHPLHCRNGGAIIFSYFISPDDITHEHERFMQKYAELASKHLSRS